MKENVEYEISSSYVDYEYKVWNNEGERRDGKSVKKIRQTKQRELILSILRCHTAALSAETIWEEARSNLPSLALTTVYRNLERLLEQKQITAVMIPEGATRYVPAGQHLHHLVCMDCDKTIDLPDCPLKAVEAQLEKDTGFTIAQHSLEIYGYCAQCKKNHPDHE